MSVVTSVTATPNRIYAVWELLQGSSRDMPRKDLEAWVTPPSLARAREDDEGREARGAILQGVLTEMANLGIVQSSDDGTVTLTEQSAKVRQRDMFRFVEERIIQPDFAEGAKQEQVSNAVAWLLTRDPRSPLPWRGGLRVDVQNDGGPGSVFDLTDEARSQQFVYWARHLGFAWRFRISRDNEVVVGDPTDAIRRHLPEAIGVGKQTNMSEALSRLAERLPVMEGGSVRTGIESALSVSRNLRTISRSTSLALLRLDELGEVQLDNPSDAESMGLDDGTIAKPVSHITWTGVN